MITIKAEGKLINTSRNIRALSSLEDLMRAKERGDILEGMCVKCGRDESLKVRMGKFYGTMAKDEISNASFEEYGREVWTRVNKPLQFIITRIYDENGDLDIMLSRKAAMKMVRDEIMDKYKAGDYMSGVIKSIKDDRIYMDAGCGNTAMILKDRICEDKSECDKAFLSFNIGEEIEFRIDSIDEDMLYGSTVDLFKGFDENVKGFEEGTFVTGTVRMKNNTGIIVELTPQLKGIANHHRNVSYGDVVTVYIKKIDRNKGKVKLEIVDDDYEEYKTADKCKDDAEKGANYKKKVSSQERTSLFQGKSPFSVLSGEKRVMEISDRAAVSFYQIIFDIKHGYINDIHYKILDIINRHRYITSKQAADFLNYEKFDVSQERVKRMLKLCLRRGMVDRCYFMKDEGRSSYKVYSMAKNGASLLKYRGEKVHWTPLEAVEKPDHIKKMLATNQIIIGYMKCSHDFTGYKINKIISANEEAGMVVRAAAVIFTEKCDYIYEVVRRKADWQNYICEKLERYKKLFQNRKSLNVPLKDDVKLVICGEDAAHVKEIDEAVKKTRIDSIDILYTEDKLNLEQSFAESLYRIEKND